MKKLFVILSLAAVIGLNSCTPDQYNADRCMKLKEQVVSDDSLTSSDYSNMITQMESCVTYVHKKLKKADDAEKMKALVADTAFQQRLEYAVGFSLVLRQNKKSFDEETMEQYRKAQEKIDKYGFDPFQMSSFMKEI